MAHKLKGLQSQCPLLYLKSPGFLESTASGMKLDLIATRYMNAWSRTKFAIVLLAAASNAPLVGGWNHNTELLCWMLSRNLKCRTPLYCIQELRLFQLICILLALSMFHFLSNSDL